MDNDEGLLVADNFESAILGTEQSFNSPTRVVYSVEKCLEVLESQGMTWEEAIEYFEFNCRGAYVGEKTPVWVDAWVNEE